MPANGRASDLKESLVNDGICPPSPDEVEVSIFGPGYGESLAIHLGGGDWAIVDSCVRPDLAIPVPIHYLNRLGVDPATAVKIVVATHWHDDHICGLADVVAQCRNASFVCSDAFLKDELLMLAESYARCRITTRTGICEFDKIMTHLEQTKRPAKAAIEGRTLWRRDHRGSPRNFDAEIRALAPSDRTVGLARRTMAALICDLGPQRRLPTLTKNESGVVLLVRIGPETIILGNDLDEKGVRGWTGIVQSREVTAERAIMFKIPHHGAESGHCDEVWNQMLQHRPYCLLTPFICGSTRIPSRSDCARIQAYTSQGYITCSPSLPRKRRKRDPTVERTIRENMPDLSDAPCSCGQVRFRMVPGDPSSRHVELFAGALNLAEVWK